MPGWCFARARTDPLTHDDMCSDFGRACAVCLSLSLSLSLSLPLSIALSLSRSLSLPPSLPPSLFISLSLSLPPRQPGPGNCYSESLLVTRHLSVTIRTGPARLTRLQPGGRATDSGSLDSGSPDSIATLCPSPKLRVRL